MLSVTETFFKYNQQRETETTIFNSSDEMMQHFNDLYYMLECGKGCDKWAIKAVYSDGKKLSGAIDL